jgi:mRNA interferase RelE/StbE
VGNLFRPDIPGHVAAVIRSLHPDLKRSVRAAIDEITANPECGEPLRGDLEGYRKYKVRRFRIVYAVDTRKRAVRIMAVAHRQEIYEELASQLKEARQTRR